MAGQQFVNQVVPYGHGSLQARSGLHYDPSHKIPDRLFPPMSLRMSQLLGCTFMRKNASLVQNIFYLMRRYASTAAAKTWHRQSLSPA
jgi:hypothetical protein